MDNENKFWKTLSLFWGFLFFGLGIIINYLNIIIQISLILIGAIYLCYGFTKYGDTEK